MNVYSKRKDGTYAIKSDVLDLKPGDAVEVETKSGNVRQETIGAKLWEGEDRYNEGQMIAIYAKADQPSPVEKVKNPFTCIHCEGVNMHDHAHCWDCGEERPASIPAAKQYVANQEDIPF